MLRAAALFLLSLSMALPASAQQADAPIQQLLQTHSEILLKSSRRTIGPAVDALAGSGLPEAQVVLERWQNKEMWVDEESGLFVFAEEVDRDTLRIFDFADGTEIAVVPDDTFDQLKPNSGIRRMIGTALVQFQLSDPDPANRATALDAIERGAEESHLAALRASIPSEENAALKQRKERLERLLTIRFAEDTSERIAAIEHFEIGRAHV